MGTINSIICAIISALFTVFFAHMSRRKTRVTIYCMENTLLTQRPNVPGLAVFVKYEDMTPIEIRGEKRCVSKFGRSENI